MCVQLNQYKVGHLNKFMYFPNCQTFNFCLLLCMLLIYTEANEDKSFFFFPQNFTLYEHNTLLTLLPPCITRPVGSATPRFTPSANEPVIRHIKVCGRAGKLLKSNCSAGVMWGWQFKVEAARRLRSIISDVTGGALKHISECLFFSPLLPVVSD